MMSLWSLVLIAGALLEVRGQGGAYYMDQPSACGQKLMLGQSPVNVHGRSRVAPPNPPTACILYLETDSTDSKYKLELIIESLNIQDCAVKLEIFDHNQAFGQTLRILGCGSKSTDTMYSTGRYITLKLSRSVPLYQPGYDFTLQIRAYGNVDETGTETRVNKIGVDVIIPLIIGALILIFIGIILCCCYRQGRLPGMHGRKPRKQAPHSGSTASITHVIGEKKANGGIDNPVVSVTPESRKFSNEKNGFNFHNPIVWSTLAAGEAGRDPATGRQRGRSVAGSISRPVPVAPPVPPVSTSTPTDRRQEELRRDEVQRSSATTMSSDPGSRRMYRKNDPSQHGSRSTEADRGKIDSYLENKGVKIAMYPDDSLKRKGTNGEDQSQTRKRGSYAEDQARKRGSYAEEQSRARGSIASEKASQRGSYAEVGTGDTDTGRSRSRKGTSPNRRTSSPGGRGTGTSPSRKGNSPSRQGNSPSRQGSSSPGRRRSPGEKRRSRDGEARSANQDAPPEGELKRPGSGFFENPDDEGYIYSYDHLYPEGETPGQSGGVQGRGRPRSGSAAEEFEEDEDGYLLVHNDPKSKPQRQGSDKRSKAATESGKPGTRTSLTDGTSYETIELAPKGSSKQDARDPKSEHTRKGSKRRSITEGPGAATVEMSRSKSGKDKVGGDPSLSQLSGRTASGYHDNLDDMRSNQYPADQQSEPSETETISNPLHSNPAVKSRIESRPLGDAEVTPSGKKRKKGNGKAHTGERDDDTVSEAGSVRYAIPPSALPGNQDPRSRLDSYPYTVGPSAALQTIVSRTTDPMAPPEQRFAAAFQNQAPSQHSSPSHVAGKAAWYVQTTPSTKGPVTHGAFMMQTTSRQPSREQLQNHSSFRPYEGRGGSFPDRIPSEEDAYRHGPSRRPYQPTSASTPHSSNRARPTPGNYQHFSPIEKAEQTPGQSYHSAPGRGHERYPGYHPEDSFGHTPHSNMQTDPRYAPASQHRQLQPRYVDPGTSIFDEPGHRAAVMRSGIDPNTGNEVNQVVWTDTIPDATDPPGPNPDVNRKTITRITTRAGHGDIPQPDSMNSQLSFQTYSNRLTAPQPHDPAFLSPSTAHHHGGQPTVPEPAYAQEYPEGDNVAFYLGLQGQARHPSAQESRVHRAPSRNEAFKDRIALPADSYA